MSSWPESIPAPTIGAILLPAIEVLTPEATGCSESLKEEIGRMKAPSLN